MSRDRSYSNQKALGGSEKSEINNISSFSGPSFQTTKEQQKPSVTDKPVETVNIKCGATVGGLYGRQDYHWRLPRNKLTPEHMTNLALNCPLAIKADHLLCCKTGDIILLEDAHRECQTDPWLYELVGEVQREGNEDPRNPKYRGDIKLIIKSVPKYTENRRIEVQMDDLKAWALHGIREEDTRIQAILLEIKKAEKRVKTLTNQLMELEYVMPGITTEEENNATSADQPEVDVTVRVKKEAEENLEKYKLELKVASEVYENLKVTFKPRAVYEEMRDFFVTFTPREKNDGIKYEDIVVGKTDWTGLKLVVSHNDHPTWVGRGHVLSGKTGFDASDYRPYQANMHKVEFVLLKHGFGCEAQVEETSQDTKKMEMGKNTVDLFSQVIDSPSEYGSTDDQQKQQHQSKTLGNNVEKNEPLLGNETMLYRGHYKEGMWHGFGLLYSKVGFYGGQFKRGSPCGQGTLHRNNGDLLQGEWGVESRFEDPEASSNPYLVSSVILQGEVNVSFSDGARYTGMMKGGRITGRGRYENQWGGRLVGEFVDGELSGHSCVEMNELGEVLEGEWKDGMLHGKGRFSSSEEGEIRGFWQCGETIGLGCQKFLCGSRFEGFWLDGKPTGIGTFWYGNVKETVPASFHCKDTYTSKRQTRVLANKVYEGNWRAGRLKTGTALTITRKNKQKQWFASGEGRWGKPTIRVMRAAETTERWSVTSRRRVSILDTSYRRRACKHNEKILLRCLNRTSEAILRDAADNFQPSDVRKELKRRNLAINHLSGLSSKSLVNFHAQALGEELIDTARPGREGGAHMYDALYCMIQSFFEGLEEEHQLLPSRLDTLAETDVQTKMSESTSVKLALAASARVH